MGAGKVNFNLDNLDQYESVFLSLGAGLQSSVMYYMACFNDPRMPKIDYAVFSDPGDEPQHTYDTLKKLISFGEKSNGPDIHIINKDGERMSDAILDSSRTFNAIPGFIRNNKTGSVGMLNRQCTREYKITPIYKHAREMIGLKRGERIGRMRVLCLQGITTDEATRMKPPRFTWADSGFPLCTARMTRLDCANWLHKMDLEMIDKSSCVYCPFNDNAAWRRVKSNAIDWDIAISVDNAIRHSVAKDPDTEVFLHRDCKPISDIDFDIDTDDLFINECEGMCGL